MVAAHVNTFAGLSQVLDRMSERRGEHQWIQAQGDAEHARYLLLDAHGDTWANSDNRLRWLNASERQRWFADVPTSLLGLLDGRAHFLLALNADHTTESLDAQLDARRMTLRDAGACLVADEAGLFAYAKGLAHWQRETRFCAFCGAPLNVIAAGHRAQCSNPECARLHFPRTDAAIIVIVEHDGACLLGRQSGWPKGRYSTLAGFVEPGESLEDAVRREVSEEAGVVVDTVSYHSSQPWPMPASLMVGFTATASTRAIALRDGELEEARWFTPQQIADGLADGGFLAPTALSVSYRLLADWLRERSGAELDAWVAAAAR